MSSSSDALKKYEEEISAATKTYEDDISAATNKLVTSSNSAAFEYAKNTRLQPT